jgi:hypothetical protein
VCVNVLASGWQAHLVTASVSESDLKARVRSLTLAVKKPPSSHRRGVLAKV